jgi:hypothetical protein
VIGFLSSTGDGNETVSYAVRLSGSYRVVCASEYLAASPTTMMLFKTKKTKKFATLFRCIASFFVLQV